MAKKLRKPNPGVTPEQFRDAPIDFGHYDIVGEALDFAPFVSMGKLRFAQIREERWPEIEAAIGVELDELQRAWLNIISSLFVFSCVIRNELPAPQRFLAELEKRAKEISSTLYELIGMLSFSDDEVAKRAPSPHRVVTTADDHFKLLGFSNWKVSVAALKILLGEVETYQDKIKSNKTKTKGRDGHYELHPLLRNLIYLAQSTGD